VQGFNELKEHAASMRVLLPHVEQDGTGAVTVGSVPEVQSSSTDRSTKALRYVMDRSLTKVERAIQKYSNVLDDKESFARLSLFQVSLGPAHPYQALRAERTLISFREC